jgi:hypothetical protein
MYKCNSNTMRKKILVKEAGLIDFFKSFFRAKAKGNESEWLQRLRKANPELADVWVDYDDKLSKQMWNQKRNLEKLGIDASHVDAIIKKYGLKEV